jgi:hypothetical protein
VSFSTPEGTAGVAPRRVRGRGANERERREAEQRARSVQSVASVFSVGSISGPMYVVVRYEVPIHLRVAVYYRVCERQRLLDEWMDEMGRGLEFHVWEDNRISWRIVS